MNHSANLRFVGSRSEKDVGFYRLERAMRVSGLDDNEMDNYFIAMMTGKEMRPSIEGSRQQGYRGGIKAGSGLRGAGIVGDYWSSSLYTVYSFNARYLNFDSGGHDWNGYSRYYGYPVRPVRP